MPYPGSNSTVIPLFELSGNLMVNYGRNLDKSVNRYTRVTPVKSPVGNYLRFNPHDIVRMTALDQSNRWAPGTPRPTGAYNTIGFDVVPFRTDRNARSITLDKRAVDIASFPVMKTHTEALGQWANTYKAYRACLSLTNPANFPSAHTATATAAGGGLWSAGTTASPHIKRSLDFAALQIQRATYGAVQWGQLTVLVNHNTALQMSQSREIREYLMQQANSLALIKLNKSEYNAKYGLPDTLYGFNLVVEDTFYNDVNRGGAESAKPVMPDNTAVVLLADGALEQPEGSTSYNTCHIFAYEEMTLETKDDQWNRLVEVSCVMDFDVQIVAPPTGFIITNLFS